LVRETTLSYAPRVSRTSLGRARDSETPCPEVGWVPKSRGQTKPPLSLNTDRDASRGGNLSGEEKGLVDEVTEERDSSYLVKKEEGSVRAFTY